MCDDCLKKLAEAFDFVKKVKKLDEKFFSARKSCEPRSSLTTDQSSMEQVSTEQIVKAVDIESPKDFDKKENFAETWQKLKQKNGEEEKQAIERISIKTSYQSRFKPSNNAVPHITAPESYLLPIPPREWEVSKTQQTKRKNNYDDYSYFQVQGMYYNWNNVRYCQKDYF